MNQYCVYLLDDDPKANELMGIFTRLEDERTDTGALIQATAEMQGIKGRHSDRIVALVIWPPNCPPPTRFAQAV